MRPFLRRHHDEDDDAYELTGGLPPPDADEAGLFDPSAPVAPPPSRHRHWRWTIRALAAAILLLCVAIGWLAVTAPLSRSLKPPMPPSITLVATDRTAFARRGAIIGKPVVAARLPAHVTNAFLAIEDRRFRSHWGIDPRGIARAAFANLIAGRLHEGGSTITQQLAKNAFLDSDRTAARKLREVMIAFWLEAWLTKDQILSRYLSTVYFGDNVYGLDAAARHYFDRRPDRLSIAQAAMLAGLVKAPTRLAPTVNLKGAQARAALVVAAMADAGFIDRTTADRIVPARLSLHRVRPLPDGTYFADWVLPAARDRAGAVLTETRVMTTLDRPLQRIAEHAVRSAGLRRAQIALVAMRPDGRVVAMVGGKSYADSPFNRATQARRQPGSAFKLFVYLAAMRAGMTPDSMVDDAPITIGHWSPKNSDGHYLGPITLRQAFARSSNVAAARLTQRVGVAEVIRAARDLGISTPIPNEATIALGSSAVSLLELTSAFAAISASSTPVRAHGLAAVAAADQDWRGSWFKTSGDASQPIPPQIHDEMLDLLAASAQTGTGRRAALSVPTYGKTGTSQDSRDAVFVGFARDLVVGVWIGNDDNSANPGLSGGGIPARVWRDFMSQALGVGAAAPPAPPPVDPTDPFDKLIDPDAIPAVRDAVGGAINGAVNGAINGLGLNLQFGRDGSIAVRRATPPRKSAAPRSGPADPAPPPGDE